MFRLLRTVAEQGVAVLLVEQFAHLALELANRAYVLQRGTVALEGPAADLLADIESIGKSYLGADYAGPRSRVTLCRCPAASRGATGTCRRFASRNRGCPPG